ESASRELGGMLGSSARSVRSTLASVATDTIVIAYLRSGDRRRADEATLAIRRLAPTAASGDVELWTPSGERKATTASEWSELVPAPKAGTMALVATNDSTAISRLTAGDSSLSYAAVARVGNAGSPLGFVVLRRRVGGQGAEASQFRAVVGPDAKVFLGN